MLKIELPWPDPILSPNKRPHWAQKAKAAKKARSDAFYACSGMTPPDKHQNEPYTTEDLAREQKETWAMSITFCPPDKRKRDLDNLLASMKNACDGICDQLKIDDSQLRPITIDWGEKVKGGKVIVEIG